MEHHLKPLGFERAPLVAQLAVQGCDGLLLTSPEAVYYTTGYPALPGNGNPILHALKNQLPFFVYLGADGHLALLCWIGATFGFSFEVDEVRPFFDRQSASDELRDFLRDRLAPQARVAIESTCPYAVSQIVGEVTSASPVASADDMLLTQRLIKSPHEIALMRRATAIVEAAVADLRGQITIGATRLGVIQAAKRALLAHGATGIGHTTIAFGTSNPEIAFDEVLGPNQTVTLDLGAVVDGYCSDNRRLLYTGAVPTELRALHQTMGAIVAQVGDALLPGTPFADLFTRANQLYEERNLPPFFLSVGHSIGLQTEEVWITAESPYIVQPGMVLNIELYTATPEGANIGDEETYLITDAGPERLTLSDPAIIGIT